MSEEVKEGSEPITLRVRDQVGKDILARGIAKGDMCSGFWRHGSRWRLALLSFTASI